MELDDQSKYESLKEFQKFLDGGPEEAYSVGQQPIIHKPKSVEGVMFVSYPSNFKETIRQMTQKEKELCCVVTIVNSVLSIHDLFQTIGMGASIEDILKVLPAYSEFGEEPALAAYMKHRNMTPKNEKTAAEKRCEGVVGERQCKSNWKDWVFLPGETSVCLCSLHHKTLTKYGELETIHGTITLNKNDARLIVDGNVRGEGLKTC